jgi:hypothetical protein
MAFKDEVIGSFLATSVVVRRSWVVPLRAGLRSAAAALRRAEGFGKVWSRAASAGKLSR